jgi:hypothetical protein
VNFVFQSHAAVNTADAVAILQDLSARAGHTVTLMCASISATSTCDTGSYPVYQTVKTKARR